jgi:hypothetical protein
MKLKKQLTEKEVNSGVDVGLVTTDDGLPVALIPLSDRAKALFVRWGMKEMCIGIVPPWTPEDFFDSCPGNWVMKKIEPPSEAFLLQEITLPQPRIVLH